MENLKRLNPLPMDGSSRRECLSGTRQETLAFIIDWLTTPNAENQNILWFHGVAGSGKSTISTTIAEYFRELRRLGAFIFFDRSKNDDPNAVIRTLAYQLGRSPGVRSTLSQVIEGDEGITTAPLLRQFPKLILEPLRLANSPAEGPVIIIIDALDECGDPRSRRDLLSLMAAKFKELPDAYRILITSREESDIAAAFRVLPNVRMMEFEIENTSNHDDIALFLRHEMASIREFHSNLNLPSDWPGDTKLHTLTRNSAGLFIWASTVVKFILEGYSPTQQIDSVLSVGFHREAEKALDSVYAMALGAAGLWKDKTFMVNFHLVLGSTLVAREPISDSVIDSLMELSGERSSRHLLSRLKCLLLWSPGESVQILHASFADYITDSARCGNQPWFIDVSQSHATLTRESFRIMESGLHFNMCHLETSFLRNDEVVGIDDSIRAEISAHLAYACRYWGFHLEGTRVTIPLLDKVQAFLDTQVLYWIEVLSLLKKLPLASLLLFRVAKWCRVSTQMYPLLVAN